MKADRLVAGDPDNADVPVVLRFFDEVLSEKRRVGLVPDLLAVDFVDHDPQDDDAGRDGVVTKLRRMWAALPADAAFVPDTIVAAGGLVSVLSRLVAWHTEVSFADFYRVRDGRIVEHWHVVDTAALAGLFALSTPPPHAGTGDVHPIRTPAGESS